MLNKLRHLLKADQSKYGYGVDEAETAVAMRKRSATVRALRRRRSDWLPDPIFPESGGSMQKADGYLDRVQEKVNIIAEEFAAGKINRDQFQELFNHYQRERRVVETWIETAPESEAWQKATTEGLSVMIRKQHMARVLGYSIYSNDSGMPIVTVGQFEVDPDLVVPMLSSYRSATEEIFGAGVRSSEIENGRWICFITGNITTMMSIFSTEPAPKQMDTLNELHELFERANRHLLDQQVVDPDSLVLPHQTVITQNGR